MQAENRTDIQTAMRRVTGISSHFANAEEVYPPSAAYRAQSHCSSVEQYQAMWKESVENPDLFWGNIAKDFSFYSPWKSVMQYDFVKGEQSWFAGSTTNVCVNCIDRHIEGGHGARPALTHEADDGVVTTLSYQELLAEVCRFANFLRAQGVKKGDVVTVYMPMVMNLAIGCLACARIGAIHNVIFAGFSAEAVTQRLLDSNSSVILTTDAGIRGGKKVPLKSVIDQACVLAAAQGLTVRKVICGHRAGDGIGPGAAGWTVGRDVELEAGLAAMPTTCEPEHMDAEDPLFILYTSGSTGKPKGVLHTQAGYMIFAATTYKYIFDVHPEKDVHFTTADIGWITGHTYIMYGPLLNGAHTVLFEGVPTYPTPSRLWEIVEKLKVTKFYTAPTALRALMVSGESHVNKCDLSSLEVLGSVGEPINPEAWRWYNRVVGKGKLPIVDTWWQTETGGVAITPLPGVSSLKPGCAMSPFFGINAKIIRSDGSECDTNETGYLVITQSWPGLMRTVYGDHEQYVKKYFSQHPGNYFAGDGARKDEDGCIWITGRIDDVLNVSGHRMSTAEIESALVKHPAVCEAAVVGVPHKIKGEGIYCYVTLEDGREPTDQLRVDIRTFVRAEIGAIASPDAIQFTQVLPKTRSGKIMRRILRKVSTGNVDDLGDTSTLADPSVVETLIQGRQTIKQ